MQRDLERTIRYFSELTADVRRLPPGFKVVYTDRRGRRRGKYVVKLFERLRDGKLDTANEIWQAKFAKARERIRISLIADSDEVGRRQPRQHQGADRRSEAIRPKVATTFPLTQRRGEPGRIPSLPQSMLIISCPGIPDNSIKDTEQVQNAGVRA